MLSAQGIVQRSALIIIQGHVFLDAGNTAQLTGVGGSLRQNARNFLSDFRLSAVRVRLVVILMSLLHEI